MLAIHELAQTRMIEQQKSTFISFKLGDQVWLDLQNLKKIITKRSDREGKGHLKLSILSNQSLIN